MSGLEISLGVIIMLVLLALVFDFMNGFHDAANSIATIVSTGVLKPQHAVAWAAFFNVVAVFVFQLKVAATIGKGTIDPSIVDHYVIFGALVGETLNAYIQRRRAELAAGALVLHPKATITEIALDFGYSGSDVFARAFKERFGLKTYSLPTTLLLGADGSVRRVIPGVIGPDDFISELQKIR